MLKVLATTALVLVTFAHSTGARAQSQEELVQSDIAARVSAVSVATGEQMTKFNSRFELPGVPQLFAFGDAVKGRPDANARAPRRDDETVVIRVASAD